MPAGVRRCKEDASTASRCKDGWSQVGEGCYQVVTDRWGGVTGIQTVLYLNKIIQNINYFVPRALSWEEVRQQCLQQGADLAEMNRCQMEIATLCPIYHCHTLSHLILPHFVPFNTATRCPIYYCHTLSPIISLAVPITHVVLTSISEQRGVTGHLNRWK